MTSEDPQRLPYADRREGGRRLAAELHHLIGRAGLLVLGLPRGGLPVADEVARELGAPLDVLVVRKLGYPGHEEYAIGAIAGGGVQVMNPEAGMRADDPAVQKVIARERQELQRRESLYRGDAPPLALRGRTVVLVDDGLATGSTMRAAVLAVRHQQPAWIGVAVPVGAAETCALLARDADEVVCPARPVPFRAVGLWYRDFPQTSDGEVREVLAAARARAAHAGDVPGDPA